MGAVGFAQKAFEIAQTINNADLLVALAELKSEYADKVTENAELKERIRQLEEHATTESTLRLQDGVYWKGDRPGGDLSAQPLCTACWDDKRKTIHMTVQRDKYFSDFFECPVCQHRATDPNGTPTSDPTAGRTHNYENY